MNYTEEQKKIIRGLNKGEFSNIWEYLVSITPKEDLSIKDNLYSQDQLSWDIFFWNEKGGEKKYRFLRVNENTEKKLLDFLKVTHDLRINNLLLPMFPYGHYIVSYTHQKLEQNKSILQIDKLLSDRLPTEPIGVLGGEIIRENFIPLPALKEFIKNDFKTTEELKHEAQTKNQKDQLELQVSSLKLTRKIAYFTIGITTLVSIVPFIYSLCTTKASDNNVTIKNPQDTIKVINITPIKPILKDSAKTDTNKK